MLDVLHPFLRRKNPRARIPEADSPEPYIFNGTENTFLGDNLGMTQQEQADVAPVRHLARKVGRVGADG
jgi:hypothetical protein